MLASASSGAADALSARPFVLGLFYGALAFLFIVVAASARRRMKAPAGLALAAAVLLGLRGAVGDVAAPLALVLALGLLAAGGSLATRTRPVTLWTRWHIAFVRTAAPLVPGAVVLALALPRTPAAARVGAAIAVVVAGALAHNFDRVQGARGGPFVLFAVSAAACYAVMPNGDPALVMLGASLPLALTSAPKPAARLGAAGSVTVIAMFTWVAVGSAPTDASRIVASLASLGLLLVEPIGRWIPQSVPEAERQAARKRGSGEHGTRTAHRDKWMTIIAVASLAQAVLGVYLVAFVAPQRAVVVAVFLTIPGLVLLAGASGQLLPIPRAKRHRSRRRSRALTRAA